MSDLQAFADRVEIEALRGEFTDAVMTNDHYRLASVFTHDGAVRRSPAPTGTPLASSCNRLGRPAVVFASGGCATTVLRRETPAHMM